MSVASVTEHSIIMNDELTDLVSSLAEVRARKRVLADEEAGLREEILLRLREEDAQVGLTAAGSQAVRIEVQNRRTVNNTKLKAMYPDVYHDCLESSSTTMLRLG